MIRWELESSKENWAVEGKSCVVCSRQLPPSEPYRLSEVGPLEVGPFEVGPLKVGPLKVGPLKVGEVRPRTAHIYSYQPCFGKLRTEEIKWPLKPLRSDSCSNHETYNEEQDGVAQGSPRFTLVVMTATE